MADAPDLIEAGQNGLLAPYFEAGTVFEHIDFGIDPVEQDFPDRPDWFEDTRVRQALIMCTDRQRMVDQILYGRGAVIHAYVPSSHPLYPADATEWPYDVAAANTLLDSARFTDSDEDGVREDPRLGGPFRVTLLAEVGNDLVEQVAAIFQDSLADCGVGVELLFLSSDVYFADGPEGLLFGRQFDLGAFPWLISIEPNCGLYLSSRIPGPENDWNRNYNNETGFSNAEFDAACEEALASLPGEASYEAGHREALRVWTEQVPIIPLFMRLKVAATRPEVLNYQLNSTQESDLWNIAEIDLES